MIIFLDKMKSVLTTQEAKSQANQWVFLLTSVFTSWSNLRLLLKPRNGRSHLTYQPPGGLERTQVHKPTLRSPQIAVVWLFPFPALFSPLVKHIPFCFTHHFHVVSLECLPQSTETEHKLVVSRG